MNVSEDQIGRWAQAPSETEDQKCLNAISQATTALRERFGNDIKIIRQGSHYNRTNIRADSDIDLAVMHTGYFFSDIAALSEADKALYQRNKVDAPYSFSQFKSEVDETLKAYFNKSAVERKNKCIYVPGNTNRVNADIVPAFELRRFSSYGVVSVKGIKLFTDRGELAISFPEQHYTNGVKKNDATKKNYKSIVRILKRVRGALVEQGIIAKDAMPSFFIECLVWNVPDHLFMQASWRALANSITTKVWNDMRDPEIAKKYVEVSGWQWLFRENPKLTNKQAEDFMLHAWKYLTQ